MRIVRPDGVVSAPLAGVPGVKSVAAQGLHDVVLDPDFARNRMLYFTYFAPPKGEAPASWPIEFFYERSGPSRSPNAGRCRSGAERVARARLSADNTSLEDVDVLAEGVERRIVIARDGTLLVGGADRFRFYDSDLDGVERTFTDNPDIRRNFTGRVIRINRDGSIPKDNPWLSRATVLAETLRARVQGSRRRGAASANRRALVDRPRAAGRRRDQHRPCRQGLRLAGRLVRTPVRRAATGRPQERSRGRRCHVEVGRRGADLLLGARQSHRRG